MGFNWKATLLAIVLFGLFLLYLHSGWFSIDLRYPLTPLRRDARGQQIQRKALIASIAVGLLIYLTSSHLSGLIGLSLSGNIAFSIRTTRLLGAPPPNDRTTQSFYQLYLYHPTLSHPPQPIQRLSIACTPLRPLPKPLAWEDITFPTVLQPSLVNAALQNPAVR